MNPIDLGDLNDHGYFATVVDSGGFSAAARLLGCPKSRLSRRVAALEARLMARRAKTLGVALGKVAFSTSTPASVASMVVGVAVQVVRFEELSTV